METAICKIRLEGKYNTIVTRAGVTPAEVVILENLHGANSVMDIEITGAKNDSHAAEKARLMARFPKYKPMVEQLFPGLHPTLPAAFGDIGKAAGQIETVGPLTRSELPDLSEGAPETELEPEPADGNEAA